jgi:cation-transporting ATPase 13A3/4/5
MKPSQKAQIIRYLQQDGTKVAMIGDGANDCSAIKQADTGISFAQTDAGT